jgi:hypothetical protein
MKEKNHGQAVRLRISGEDLAAWKAAAKANGLSLSEYIRRRTSNKPTKPAKPVSGDGEGEYRHGGLTPAEWIEVWRAKAKSVNANRQT